MALNRKENEKPIPYGLRLDSVQWRKEHKDERETNSLRINISFHSMDKRTEKKKDKPTP